MREGAVVLVSLPQADGSAKMRPALILRELPGHRDWLVCGLSTQLHERIANFDEVLDTQESDFKTSGLLQPSLIRLAFLGVVPRRAAHGSIGSISRERHARLLRTLSEYLIARTPPA
jgi:mRNA interferase MazF